MVNLTRTLHHLRPDPSRLVTRPFIPGSINLASDQTRVERIVHRILEQPEDERRTLVESLILRHGDRFSDIETTWLAHFEMARERVDALGSVTDRDHRLLVGAYLTQAYAYESVALTNPSMVPIGDPAGGVQQFVMSARAIGEGHISSIAFLTGSVDESGAVELEERHPHVSNGRRTAPSYSKAAFADKLDQLGFVSVASQGILALVGDTFTIDELDLALSKILDSDFDEVVIQDAVKRVHWLAASNYEVTFDPAMPISEHVISPAAPIESQGMEDARFVRFTDDDGSTTYYATYTAFDGVRILPQLMETRDFNRFRMSTMTGPAVHHKGMAIFPRKIHGDYVALSRHDHERSYIMRSDSVRTWRNAEVVFGPEYEWDTIQTGNCGSPIETEQGWLVVTHGVGPMRRYVLGAVLLDVDEPTKVVARLPRPFIEPESDEAEGYVPDVVYSCGSMLHNGNLITPFGYADVGIKIAVTPIDQLIAVMN
ncbi:MAG: glycoside hydrolase family 130 protein [Acidimicrobiia bacterium]